MIKLLKRMRLREISMCIICVFFILGQVYFDLLLPDYMSELTVLIQTSESELSAVIKTGCSMLGCVVSSAVLCIGSGYLAARTASGFTTDIRKDLFGHVMKLDQNEIQKFSIPSLITRTTNDVTQIQMVVAMGLQNIVKAPVMAIWAIIKILGKSTELSLLTAVFVAVMCTAVFIIFSVVLPKFRLVQRLTDKINRIARENLTGISVIHAFNAESYQNEKFDKVNKEIFKTQLFNQRMFASMQPLMQMGMNGLSLSVYWVGAYLLSNITSSDVVGRLTMFGNIIVFGTYATYVVMSFMMLVMIFMMFPAAQVSAERINEVLDTETLIKEGTVTLSREKGSVEFKNVTYRYPGASGNAIENISFKVNKGETLAVIGATGSGKTTLIELIPRFRDVLCGSVFVDGVNVKDYSFKALYDRIGYVTQRAVLFSGTVSENVAFGECKKNITENDIAEAIEISQANDFVKKLGDGFHHKIAQGGRNVSGGQKQRLSIARAIAREAEILIFDDSFSALDYRTDLALRSALEEKLSDTTKIIVAQRISTIRHADKIIVLDEGKAVGMGTHDELMTFCKVYREIAESQLSASEC